METSIDKDMENAFDSLRQMRVSSLNDDVVPFNVCDKCGGNMIPESLILKCLTCGIMKNEDGSSSNVLGTGGVSMYCSIEYSRVQYNQILNQLLENSQSWTGNAFPQNVFKLTAQIYNGIQKNSEERFVKRGAIKNEIIASIINNVCQNLNLDHKRKDIANFMKLQSGFSRGDTIVRYLAKNAVIDFSCLTDSETVNPIKGFTERYLEALDIVSEKNKQLIMNIVQTSEDRKIGMNSQISSKVVGAIWLLLEHNEIKIDLAKLEKATDNTKKNTFYKFVEAVRCHPSIFKSIWKTYDN